MRKHSRIRLIHQIWPFATSSSSRSQRVVPLTEWRRSSGNRRMFLVRFENRTSSRRSSNGNGDYFEGGDKCSNNRAEQMAIVNELQAIDTIQICNNTPITIMIHTNRRIILKSLKNMKNRHQLIEESRKRLLHWRKKTMT